MERVILISVDGMRPDGFLQCKHPYIEEIMKRSYYTLDGKTVSPSVTLPCHMSLFHSVPPTRHGITTNLYTPPVRPINGLFEQLKNAGASCAMYYGWEPLRDVSRPSSLRFANFYHVNNEDADTELTNAALSCIEKNKPDFVFLYLVDTDHSGHDSGWMTESYLQTIHTAIENIRRVVASCEESYSIIITADHGGHDRSHGTEQPEDMVIPMFYMGPAFPENTRFAGGSILDIAPTIAKLMGVSPAPEWEGTAVI